MQPKSALRNVTLKERSINLALATIARDYQIPIGIEMSVNGDYPVNREIELDFKDATLPEVLNSIVKQDPRYSWKTVDDVINFYPSVSQDALLRDLLETRIGEFSFANHESVYRLRYSVVELPEIRAKLSRAGVAPQIVAYTGIDFEKMYRDFSFTMSDVTLRKILNRLIRESDWKFRIVNRICKKELFLLNF